jgi:hypothetical protein
MVPYGGLGTIGFYSLVGVGSIVVFGGLIYVAVIVVGRGAVSAAANKFDTDATDLNRGGKRQTGTFGYSEIFTKTEPAGETRHNLHGLFACVDANCALQAMVLC